MSCTNNKFARVLLSLTIVFTLVLLAASSAHATIVGAQSFGDELAGGRITVTYSSGAVAAAPIVAGGPGQGMASVPSMFDFSVTGDTFLADWMLTNTSSFDSIQLVEFDLTGTTSPGSPAAPGPHSPGVLFDDGRPAFETPNGFAGRAGAQQVNVGLPLIINSFELDPWLDPMNNGDEWVKEAIEYEGFDLVLT